MGVQTSEIGARTHTERFGFACGLSASPVRTRARRHDDVEVALPLGGTAVAPGTLPASMATWAREIGTAPALTLAAAREAEACLLRAATTARPAHGAHGAPASSRPDRLVTATAAWVSAHFREPVTLADVARSVHVHPSTATAAFRRHVGVSIGEYLAQCRTAEAQRLLIGTDATTAEIAAASGFGSVGAFYERFGHDVGMAPGAYRRTARAGVT